MQALFSRSLPILLAILAVTALTTSAGAAVTQVAGASSTTGVTSVAAGATLTLPVNLGVNPTDVDVVVLFVQSSDNKGATGTHIGSSATLGGSPMTIMPSPIVGADNLGESKNGPHYTCLQMFYFPNNAGLTGSRNVVLSTPNAMAKVVMTAIGLVGVQKADPILDFDYYVGFSKATVGIALATVTDSLVLFGCVQDSDWDILPNPITSLSLYAAGDATGVAIRAETFKINAPAATQPMDFTLPNGTAGVIAGLALRPRDITPPTLSTAGGIVRANPSPTNAPTVNYTVTFSEPVNGVSASDFTLYTEGLSGASITSVTPASGPSAVYNVAVNTGSGSGLLRLDIPASPTISDVSGNAFVGPYTGGEAYTVDKTLPTGTLIINGGAAFTNDTSSTLAFTTSKPVVQMQFSLNNTDWSAWQDYAATTTFPLVQVGSNEDGLKTVYARFRDVLGNTSTVQISDTITLDTTAPVGTLSIDAGTHTNSNVVNLTLSATDALSGVSKMRFSNTPAALDSWSAWENYATTKAGWSLLSGDGPKTVYVQYQDVAGNNSASDGTGDTITLDTQNPPAPNVSVVPVTNNPRPQWTWTPGEAGNVLWRYQLDSGAWTETPDMTFTPDNDLADGSYTLYVQERDSAGNWSESGSAMVEIDTVPPSAPIVDGPPLTRNLQPTWTWTCAPENDGIEQFRIQVDGETEEGWSSTTAFLFRPDAPFADKTLHTLFVQERDAAGNWSASGSFEIEVDSDAVTAPEVTGITPTNDTTPEWTWISGGGLQQYRFQFESETGTWTETTELSFVPAEELAEGTYTLYVQERLSSVMWSESGSFAITVDLTAPAPPVVTGPPVSGDPRPEWEWTPGDGTGNGQFQYKIDDGPWIDTEDPSYIPDEDLPEGEHTVCVRERDEAGNWSEPACHTIIVDFTGPAAPIVEAPSITSSRKPTWSWSSGGAGGNGTFRYQMNSELGDWTVNATQSFTPEADLAEGDHTLYVQERDEAGNWSASGSKTVQVRPTAPNRPTVNCPSLTNNPQPTWTWTGTNGIGSFRYQLDTETGAWITTTGTSFTPDAPLGGGLHTVYVQEQSLAGVWSLSGFKSTVIDLTPPGAPVVKGPAISGSKRPTWSWTSGGGGNSGFRYKMDSAAGWTETTATQFTPTSDLPMGHHTLYVQERDEAGNWSASGSFSIQVSPPTAGAPVVSGPAITSNQRPLWYWSSGGGGIGIYRFQMGSESGQWTQTTEIKFRELEPMADGEYTLYVQEKDPFGSWSPSGTWTIVIDNQPPNPPVVTGATPVNTKQPTWTWISGGSGGNGLYRVQLDSEDGFWTYTRDLSFTPSSPLLKNAHTLYVQESDLAGNWSASTLYVIVIDPNAVNPPVVTGPAHTSNTTPTWTWTPGGGGQARYRCRLDGGPAVLTQELAFTPATALSVGAHTLEVQEANAFGDWSWPGSYTININLGLPEITLTGDNPVDVSAGSEYTDEGATAQDAIGNDITSRIVTTGLPVDTNVIGSYTVTYNVEDEDGNDASEVTRTVNVVSGVTDVSIAAPLAGSTIYMPSTGATALVALTSVAPEGSESVTYSFDGVEVGTATAAPWLVVLELTPAQALYGEHTLSVVNDEGNTESVDEINVNIAALPEGADTDANGLPDNPFSTLGSGDMWIHNGVAMLRVDDSMPVASGATNVVALANPANVEQRMMASVSSSVLATGQTGIILVQTAASLTALLGADQAANVAALPEGLSLATELYATVNVIVTENEVDFWNLDSETLAEFPVNVAAQDDLADGASLYIHGAELSADETDGVYVSVNAEGEWSNEAVLDYSLANGTATSTVNALGLFAVLQSESGEGEGEGEPTGCFAAGIEPPTKFNGDGMVLLLAAALLLPVLRMRTRSVMVR